MHNVHIWLLTDYLTWNRDSLKESNCGFFKKLKSSMVPISWWNSSHRFLRRSSWWCVYNKWTFHSDYDMSAPLIEELQSFCLLMMQHVIVCVSLTPVGGSLSFAWCIELRPSLTCRRSQTVTSSRRGYYSWVRLVLVQLSFKLVKWTHHEEDWKLF